MNSAVLYDVLYLTARLQRLYGNTTLGELLLFSYLSCILHRFGGNLSSDWGYSYGTTHIGAPFSEELSSCVAECQDHGMLSSTGHLELTGKGDTYLEALSGFSIYEDRRVSLEAAADTAIFVSSGNLRKLLEKEPSLAASRSEGSVRQVPDASSSRILDAQFKEILQTIGHVGVPRLVAAAGWLKSLDTDGSQPL